MKLTKLSVAAAATILALGLQGCVIAVNDDGNGYSDGGNYSKLEKNNREAIAGYVEGVSLATVQAELGTPNFSDLWTVNDVRYRVMYYRTHRVHADGNTTRDECTPLVFADGVLIGTGNLALERIPQNN